jgi:hypothetical protein
LFIDIQWNTRKIAQVKNLLRSCKKKSDQIDRRRIENANRLFCLFLFSQGGGSFPGTIGRIEHGFNCRPDLVAVDNPHNPRRYLDRFFIDSLVHDPVALQSIVDLFGSKQICLGSDYPFPLGEDRPGTLVEQANFLSEEQKAEILWQNGLKFLGLEHRERFFLGLEEENSQPSEKSKNHTEVQQQIEATKSELEQLEAELKAEANQSVSL